jgi:hypothetical protein
MFGPNLTKDQLHKIIDGMSDLDFVRLVYCQEMAGTYMSVGLFEDMLISAMHMCDRVKLKKILGEDTDEWAQSLAKKTQLRGSTLGSLIKILEGHSIAEDDLRYLKWIKDKRDYFVHRLFHEGAWPGELDAEGCRLMARRLSAIQIWLSRGQRNIWAIFERAGFVELSRLSDGSFLAMNMGVFDLLDAPDGEDGPGDAED